MREYHQWHDSQLWGGSLARQNGHELANGCETKAFEMATNRQPHLNSA